MSSPEFARSVRSRLTAAPPPPAAPPRRGWVIGLSVALAAVALWAGAATWALLFREEFAARFVQRQAEMQRAYEDRIAALKTRLDQVASQRLLEKEALEGRIGELAGRQAQLETRHALIASLADQARTTASPARARSAALAESDPLPASATSYAPIPVKPALEPDALGLRLREGPGAASEAPGRTSSLRETSPEDKIAALERSVAAFEGAQLKTLDGIVSAARSQALVLRTAIAEVGVDPDRGEARAKAGLGGPLVPVPSGGFPSALDAARETLAQLERLRRLTSLLPFARPSREAEVTSGFGVRLDPFTRGPALHTGLDFRADYGSPVRATGAGRVVGAEPSGGYGLMVEIDHGHGITTRYAHLSAMSVTVGQVVTAGTVVGRVGSTGRSTGPHIHYEIRINGDAVDPQRFLRAGARLAATR
jgi:murein DD-endopeptidase MepM/ murein hydrolase activator NlpD